MFCLHSLDPPLPSVQIGCSGAAFLYSVLEQALALRHAPIGLLSCRPTVRRCSRLFVQHCFCWASSSLRVAAIVGSRAVTPLSRQPSTCLSCFQHWQCRAAGWRPLPVPEESLPWDLPRLLCPTRQRARLQLGEPGHCLPCRTTLFPAPQPLPVAYPFLPPKAAGGRVYPVSVPYSSAQSTSKTSVTLSLVMPSQGQLVNGAHSSSTLDEATPTLTK